MRMPYVAAIVLLSGLAACSWMEGKRSSNSQTSYGSTSASPPSTSSMSGSSVMNESQARQNLRAHGYGNVSNLHRSGDDWVGTATDNSGQPVNFDMNPAGVIAVMP
ncbi:MAG TPA: hypothetical protein VF502_07295 [Stellaceae bacterium]